MKTRRYAAPAVKGLNARKIVTNNSTRQGSIQPVKPHTVSATVQYVLLQNGTFKTEVQSV